MKYIIFLLLSSLALCGTTSVIYVNTFTLDRSVTPQLSTDFDSAYVMLYRDDGVTKLDSGYTDVLGRFRTTKYHASNYNRIYVTKTGYGSAWTRFSLAGYDSLGDTLIVPHRMFVAAPCSTSTLTIRLVSMTGIPKTNQLITVYNLGVPTSSSDGTNKWFMTPTVGNNAYYEQTTVTTDASGIAEIDLVKGITVGVKINEFYVGAIKIDADKDLDSLNLNVP